MKLSIGVFKTHVTLEGERWDQIAWHWYGDPFLVEPLIQYNPGAPIYPRAASSTVLAVPILPVTAILPSIEGKPPWA